MTKRILADIDVILKRIEEAYPAIPELSRAEVAVLKSVASGRTNIKLSQMQSDPEYRQSIKKQKQWKQHMKTVVTVNEETAKAEPEKTNKKKPRGTGKPPGRPQEYDPIAEGKLAQRWQERDGTLTKKQFAETALMTVHEFDKLLRRVRARESRERAKH